MNYFNHLKNNKTQVEIAKVDLNKKGIVNITHFFNKYFINKLIKDTLNVYQLKLKRKDILMKHTDNTPRNMYYVEENSIQESSRLIPNFYHNRSIVNFLSILAQEKIMQLPWSGEKYVINGLEKSNDTHGWHWDDYSYALIFIARAPNKENGGCVECISNCAWNKSNPKINELISKNKPDLYYFESGSFYLMKSDTTLHRVAPIIKTDLRVAIAMSWCTSEDLLKDIDHKTVYALYGK